MTPLTFTKDDLIHFNPRHDFFVGIDSDGCVLDTMETKQRECFHGLIVDTWGLQPIESLVRETAEFVNLYSQSRGTNRYPALVKVVDLLRKRPEVRAAGVVLPGFDRLRRWMEEESELGVPALRAAVAATHDAELMTVLQWTNAVDKKIEAVVKHMQPFTWVRESLQKIGTQADIIVVSQTPAEALVREWKHSDIIHFVSVIAGQEMGTKAEHIAMATRDRYPPNHVLMIGDAPGDCAAAKTNSAHFYPINPGNEEKSWKRLYNEAFDKFVVGAYAGAYESTLIAEFETLLPEVPPWGEGGSGQ